VAGYVRRGCSSGANPSPRPLASPPSLRGHMHTDILTRLKIPISCYPNHAAPWRRGAPKVQDGLEGSGGNILLHKSRLCEANPSPRPLASPPSLRGHMHTDILTRLKIPISCYPNHAAPWRRGAPKVQDGLEGSGGNILLHKSCLCEADPSPRLLAVPLSLRGHAFMDSVTYHSKRAGIPASLRGPRHWVSHKRRDFYRGETGEYIIFGAISFDAPHHHSSLLTFSPVPAECEPRTAAANHTSLLFPHCLM
jgi:hypothetical protein